MKKIGQVITYNRTKQGLSIQGLANRTGISRMTVSRIEKGQTTLSLKNAITLFKTLGIDKETLINSKI